MRIIQLCTDFEAGGIQRHVLDLGAWLRRRGHHVAYAGSPGKWLDEGMDDGFFGLDFALVGVEGGNVLSRLVRAVRYAVALRRILKQERIELIHAHETAPSLVARLATLGMKVPIILTHHGAEHERIPQAGRLANLTADRIVTPSHYSANELHERGGVPKSKLSVIGLGVQPAPPVDQVSAAQFRRELLGRDGKLLVVMVARLAPQKGIDVLVDVVRHVTRDRTDLRFVVVGDGSERDLVKGWAEQAGVSSYLQFVGQSDEVYKYLHAGDLFLLTSRWEALPITIVEAFRAGLPVVATACSGVVELVDKSVGRVVAIEDVDAIAGSILEICGNDELRRELSANAQARSREDRFLPAHIHEIFEQTYAEMLGQTLPPAADRENG